MTHISPISRALLTLVFVGAGGAKLAGAAPMIASFDTLWMRQWLRYAIGAMEVLAPIVLWLPSKQIFGASILGGTMVGAVVTHWFILGPSALPAIVLGLISTAILYLHRDQIDALMGRLSVA